MSLAAVDQKRLQDFLLNIRNKTDQFLGYPVSKDFDFQPFADFLDLPLNNLGDPFVESTWKVDSRQYEREVVAFMADLFRAEKDNFWGYVTNGGSEGNLYGLYLARELYPKAMVYYSQDTHYSVKKNLHLLGMENIMIKSQPNGEINYNDLHGAIKMHRNRPAIVFANIGTTMTEAKDDVRLILEILEDLVVTEKYIHADAALCGGLAPFISPRIPFDFQDGVDSISVSGHKSFGSPIPCGIVVAKKNNVEKISRSIDYIGTLDTTISGSRNGHTPLFLWYKIKSLGKKGMQKRVDSSLAIAQYAEQKLLEIDIPAWRNDNAITVVFPQVEAWIKEKYQLASANGITHLVLMPSIKKSQIDSFVLDVSR